jgi:dTDP-4-dehydrorhamnose 3,5-epimerase
MRISPTAIPDLNIATTPWHRDARGAFGRLYCDVALRPVLGQRKIVQINLSHTRQRGTVRGLHFQRGTSAELKCVRCLRGLAWDVAVDLREGSPTYLRWLAVQLSPEEGNMVIIPEGFAHGFQALADDTELLYLHTAHYAAAAEAGVRYDDPQLAIGWPLPAQCLSDRDLSLPFLGAQMPGAPLGPVR